MHLRSLGLSKSQIAITFLAGPISGIFVQPLVGLWSDRCQLPWGKRRPFIAVGGIILNVSLLGLAWTKSLVDLLFGSASVQLDKSNRTDTHSYATIVMANTLTFCLYFATQPVQVGIRALIIDVCPPHQQKDVNAWVVRTSGVANALGYLSAFLDLPQYLCLFDTQFKNLSVIACLSLSATLLICCVYVVEDNQYSDISIDLDKSYTTSKSIWKVFRQTRRLFNEILNIPKQIAHIYMVQFFVWIGWYPYLLYATT